MNVGVKEYSTGRQYDEKHHDVGKKHSKIHIDFHSSYKGFINENYLLAYNSVRQRTAENLLKVKDMKDKDNDIRISREDLAKMVGTAPESVIRVLSDFKDEGLIEIESGKIKIVQPAKLEKVVRWSVAR